jgi:hypothetical protein
MGGSTQYDLSTAEGRAKVPENLGVWLRAGYSLAQAAAIAAAGKNMINANDPLFRTPGPRVPGFAEGGTIEVGEHGSEIIRAPLGSQVFKHGTSPRDSGSSVSVNIMPGAIVLQYPVMRDRQAMDALGEVVSEALGTRLSKRGVM